MVPAVDNVHCSFQEKGVSNSVMKPSLASRDSPTFTPLEIDPTYGQMIQHLRRANQIAIQSVQAGHHPFGAILVAPDQDTVLLEQGNVDSVNHAEAVLTRAAWTQFTPEILWNCTIYSTVEPCVMCAGTQYWANIGRLVYGISEAQLRAFTGNHPENPTLDLPCRSIFERGQKNIKVWGPFPEVESEIVAIHQDFWKPKSASIL